VRASYFPGEAARILGLKALDYHQLRKIFALVRSSSAPRNPNKRWEWARYTFRDLVALKTALRIVAHPRGGRLDINSVKKACELLRTAFGLANPLTEVPLDRLGDAIIARVDDKYFDASTGQRLIDEVASDLRKFVDENCSGQERSLCYEQIAMEKRAISSERSLFAATATSARRRGDS